MYVTLAQLAERPGAQELAQVATPADQPIIDTALMQATLTGADRSAWTPDQIAVADAAAAVITDAVASADAIIDGFVIKTGRPLPLDPVPTLVVQWSRAITRYTLHKDRISDPKSDPIARDYADAMKLLQMVAQGTLALGVGDPQPPSGLGPVGTNTGTTRQFTEDSLADFETDFHYDKSQGY